MRFFGLLLLVSWSLVFQACNRQARKEEVQTADRKLAGAVRHEQYGSCDSVSNAGIYVKLNLWQPTGEDTLAKTMSGVLNQKTIKKINAFGDPDLIKSNPAALESVAGAFQVFENNYKSFKKTNPDAPGCWMMELTGDTLMTTSKALCYQLFEVSFVGGAHPNSFRSFHVFDRKTGIERPMKDYVTDSAALVKLVEKEFRKVEKLSPEADLDQSGYFLLNHTFVLPLNYIFAREGVRFYYNPYEIAPYARGAIDFTIPYTALEGIIRKDIF
ncbi:DUF3298 domain-containing protein [Dyadobacter sandarakinus]|uniref:DUF3298 domain-containing protein n=2 Tax=Dyadobacter sandarakinus TaxID=2747268 RepID=A0ABX7IEC5_9BACT|nr:DUF3298 domain-containing protein [Dyadobacter sandarakinus]